MLKKSVFFVLLSINCFSQNFDVQIEKVQKKLVETIHIDKYYSYSLSLDRWNKNKLDTLFIKLIYLERYNPKYLGTFLKDEDTYEEINIFSIISGFKPHYLYTNNYKQFLIVSDRLYFQDKNLKKFSDLKVKYSLTKSVLNSVYPDYNLKRLDKWQNTR